MRPLLVVVLASHHLFASPFAHRTAGFVKKANFCYLFVRAKNGQFNGDDIMPKIFNTSWLAVLAATFIFYLIGFAWYGYLFKDIWLTASGMTETQTNAMAEAKGAMMFVWGILITLAQALGLLWVINLAGAKRLPDCLKIAFWLFITLAAPLLTYACLYGNYSLTGIMVDFGHILLAYLVMAAIYAAFRLKDAVSDE